MARIRSFIADENGASLVEYALLVALIALVAFVAVATLGKSVSNSFDSMGQGLP
ncbi:MAG TPA: Flp family type IVb pilin [Acidimicrobiia bacterium]|jgi:pilus assembly protein Flp/PilA